MIDLDTLVVAILSAFLGGLAGTWLRVRHERDEAMRDRQLTAADDFSTGLHQALLALRNAKATCLKHGFVDPQQRLILTDPATGKVPAAIEEALQEAERVVDEAAGRQARIALLFGPYAPSGRTAQLAVIELQGALEALAGWPRPDLDRYREYGRSANRALDDFNERALADIRGRPWHRRWRSALWVRRRIRKPRERRAERRAPAAEAESGDGEPSSSEPPGPRDRA